MNIFRKITVVAMLATFAAGISANAPADQPFMQAALTDLREAMTHLRNATADKGGHWTNGGRRLPSPQGEVYWITRGCPIAGRNLGESRAKIGETVRLNG